MESRERERKCLKETIIAILTRELDGVFQYEDIDFQVKGFCRIFQKQILNFI